MFDSAGGWLLGPKLSGSGRGAWGGGGGGVGVGDPGRHKKTFRDLLEKLGLN